MGAEKFGDAVALTVAGGGIHTLEHLRRRVGVHACVVQRAQSHPVRFCFIGAAITQLRILCEPLRGRHGCETCVGADGGGQ